MLICFFVVNFLWIFFRAPQIGDAFTFISNMMGHSADFTVLEELETIIKNSMFSSSTLNIYLMFLLTISILGMLFREIYAYKKKTDAFGQMNKVVRRLCYFAMTNLVIFHWMLMNGIYGDSGGFIYFQF